MSASKPVIVWFRNDLRLADNPALCAAAESGRPLIPVYIHDDEGPRPPGGAGRWWLHHSLASLAGALEERGARLVLRRGNSVEQLASLASETGADSVFFTRAYEPGAVAREAQLKERLGDQLELRRRVGQLLFEPEQIATGDGRPYRVFTPFWKTCLQANEPRPALPLPGALPGFKGAPATDQLADWGLLPERPDWSDGIRAAWQPGEAAAQSMLDEFLEAAVKDYADDRDRPYLRGTSRLSPYLRFGEIGPRQVWHAVRERRGTGEGGEAYLRELGWREFSAHLLFHWPELPDKPLRPEFAAFPWSDDTEGLAAWQRGLTGYPIVDAGMRELWHTGWMHNRVRMVTASFLVKDLLVPWQQGERWFWDTLVDADPANNAASWQWVAGCGADAAPFFRVFNPTRQGQRFDPDGKYVRRWIPQLANLPDKFVHTPWEAPDQLRQAAGIGADYPLPIIDHHAARQRALDAFEAIKA